MDAWSCPVATDSPCARVSAWLFLLWVGTSVAQNEALADMGQQISTDGTWVLFVTDGTDLDTGHQCWTSLPAWLQGNLKIKERNIIIGPVFLLSQFPLP